MKAEAEVREQRSEIRGQRSAVSAAKTIHYSLFPPPFSFLLIPFPSSSLRRPYLRFPDTIPMPPFPPFLVKSLSIGTLGSGRKPLSVSFTGTEASYYSVFLFTGVLKEII